jgi:phage-related minor tail protein
MIGIESARAEADAQIDALQGRFEETGEGAAQLTEEMKKLRENMLFTQQEVGGLSRSFSADLKGAFDDVVFDGKRLSDALRDIALSMAEAVYNTAMRPVQDTIGSAIAGGINSIVGGVLGNATGGAIQAFAKGGVVGGPTLFSMRRGVGLMGEAGAEAILPLARGTDGRLGVRAGGGEARAVNVTVNVSTPDVEGFRRSKSQIALQMNRALELAGRNR